MNHVKGTITRQTYVKKYDADGIPYKDYELYVNNLKYTARIKEDIYLENGMMVLLDVNPGSVNKVLAGGYKHAGWLKNK